MFTAGPGLVKQVWASRNKTLFFLLALKYKLINNFKMYFGKANKAKFKLRKFKFLKTNVLLKC